MRPRFVLLTAVLAGMPVGVRGQDVEMLGERYGSRPPASYYRLRAQDPTAFEFSRGLPIRLRLRLEAEAAGASAGGAQRVLRPPEGPVVGTYEVPVLLGLFENSPPAAPFTRDQIAAAYFGGQAGTITDYYAEVSGARVTLVGDVRDWRRVDRPDTAYTVGENGIPEPHPPVGGGGAANFVWDLLELQVGVDWGRYDNDGPDGVANSGDDDGYVDVLAVMHPTLGGECGSAGDQIWSHRWSLSSAVGEVYRTTTPSASGGFVRVDDYTIQATLPCSGSGLNPIGVFTHELGHAFGLPDLYDTDSSDGLHAGAGIWDLMSSGNWGCDNASPATPCHMGAWSKAQLGWVDVVTLAPDLDHGVVSLPPVESAGTVYRIDANDGSGEYFLLENRQRLGYDQNLYAEGLLVWQVDPDWILARWGANTVNGAPHRGVWLRQADGLDQLGRSRFARGDAADPFPGAAGNTAFHAASDPAATSYQGGATGVTLVDIATVGDEIELHVSTRFTSVTVRAEGSSGSGGLFTLDGVTVLAPEASFVSAPFVPHVIEASAGEELVQGERRSFLEWSDAPGEARIRPIETPMDDTELVATYGGTQFRLDLTSIGAVSQVSPASFDVLPSSADLWYDDGTTVSVEARPIAGYGFVGWQGDLAGQPNPVSFTMTGPREVVAAFELVYSVPATSVQVTATEPQDVQLLSSSGTGPYTWRAVGGALPIGLYLSGTGLLSGAAIEMGSFAVDVEAVDANGLAAVGTLSIESTAPTIPIETLVAPFLLSGPAPTPVQRAFLDRQGNGVAGYDIGDLRAWILANPGLPMRAELDAILQRRTIMIETGRSSLEPPNQPDPRR